MRRPCAKATNMWAQCMLPPPVSFLGGEALQEVVEWNLRHGVGGRHA
jgi:hypothetical protein